MQNRRLHAVVLNHVPFEDLGSLEPRLRERGFAIETVDVSSAPFPLPQAATCDLLIVLGGPIGVYDSRDYPFLTEEIATIRQRLDARRPILGICLGAQLVAAALGARVYPGAAGAEIGWYPLQPVPGSHLPSWFQPLLAPGLQVFHWHGDTFDLPDGAVPFAETQAYINQAFMLDNFALCLQFHAEVTAAGLERWYLGHAAELHARSISVPGLRAASERHAPALASAAEKFWKGWLDSLFPAPPLPGS